MAELLKSKELALVLPLVALAYVAGLFYFQLESVSAYRAVRGSRTASCGMPSSARGSPWTVFRLTCASTSGRAFASGTT